MAELDASKVQGEADVQGTQRPVEGTYHVVVNSVTYDQKDEAYLAELEVLAGTPGNQRGRKLKHRMRLNDGCYTDRHLRFALATGLIKPGEKKDVDWDKAVGRQLVVGVQCGTFTGDDGKEHAYSSVSNFGLDLWGLGNPDVADVPKDQKAIELMQGGAAAAGAGSAVNDPYANI